MTEMSGYAVLDQTLKHQGNQFNEPFQNTYDVNFTHPSQIPWYHNQSRHVNVKSRYINYEQAKWMYSQSVQYNQNPYHGCPLRYIRKEQFDFVTEVDELDDMYYRNRPSPIPFDEIKDRIVVIEKKSDNDEIDTKSNDLDDSDYQNESSPISFVQTENEKAIVEKGSDIGNICLKSNEADEIEKTSIKSMNTLLANSVLSDDNEAININEDCAENINTSANKNQKLKWWQYIWVLPLRMCEMVLKLLF